MEREEENLEQDSRQERPPVEPGDSCNEKTEVPTEVLDADVQGGVVEAQPEEASELEVLRTQVAEARDGLLRARAEMENLHKRQRRELELASRYALDHFLRELLPVLDSLESGCRSADTEPVDMDAESLLEGLQLTMKLLHDRMQKSGVEVVDPAVDTPFDPELHEAVSTQPGGTPGSLQVTSVLQKGYKLHDRLLRPARVIVTGE